MSNPEKADTCVPDTQETYYEESNNEKPCGETQSTALNESQDFRLVDYGEDSVTEKAQPLAEDNCQKPVKVADMQETSNASAESKTDNKSITASNNKVENEREVTKDEATEKKFVEKNEVNDELTDEDEIIQGTPPHSYTPPKKAEGDIEGASLKRKAGSFEDSVPSKVLRTISTDDTLNVKEQFMQEESRQSCKSDDSYDDIFKNTERNVIIEETQDPASELTQNSMKNSTAAAETMDCGNEEQEEKEKEKKEEEKDEAKEEVKVVFSEKCCDVEKDENLNVSAKLAESSANDSTIVNVNSLHESDIQVDECEPKGTVASTDVAPENVDEKSQAETPDKNEADEKSPEVKDAVADPKIADEGDDITGSTNCVEKPVEAEETKKPENDEEVPSAQPKVSNESPLCLRPASSFKSRTSVELLYDGASETATNVDSEPKPEIVEIDDDTEKSILESSAEVIYEPTNNGESKSKPEVVNIDDSHEDGERIVLDHLDSNSEVTAVNKGGREEANETLYKSCYDSKSDFSYKSVPDSNKESLDSRMDSSRMVNGSNESKIVTAESETFAEYETPSVFSRTDTGITSTFSSRKLAAKGLLSSKDLDNIELISISDHEQDTSNTDDGARNPPSDLIHNSALAKAVQVEKEIGMYVKLRCFLQIDENTKEFLGKELTAVQCEPVSYQESTLIRQKDDTGSSSLADISDNKETSPGSVNSNIQQFHLNPSRLSMMSSISSSSSASSAASLAAKLAIKENIMFSMPRGPAKHAKKMSQDVPSSMSEKQTLDETYDRLTREWGNNRLLTTTVLNCLNAELIAFDTHNISNERLDDHHLQKMHSSTPEVPGEQLTATPKSTKKSKSLKRPRSKGTRLRGQTNSESKSSANTPTTALTSDESTPRVKKSKTESSIISDDADKSKLVISDAHVLANSSPLPIDNLIGKKVFAKWSDNNYYPGIVTDRVKTKYKINFFDGKNKVLIPEFVVLIPKTLRVGLSVYATTETNDYGSCGIIVDVKSSKNIDDDDDVSYIVETDEGEHLQVQVRDLFLSTDQVQILKEEVDSESNKSQPTTPKHPSQVTLENMVDGKRRSRRIGTPIFSTPKSRNSSNSSSAKIKSEPSVSGMSVKIKKERSILSENESMSSDANIEPVVEDEYALLGVQKEIIGTPHEQIVKGPKSRNKSKRSKKKVEDEQTIATQGPIPTDNTIFKGMSFILACVSLDGLDRYEDPKNSASGTEEAETDNETEWTERPFVRDRLHTQILAGGGKIYEDFNDIPKDEYENTKFITNVPNATKKSILCLSVGIHAYNHKWIIRCCSEGKLVNCAEEVLPAGWSLQRRAYMEQFQIKIKPLSQLVVIIPNILTCQQFTTFWSKVCDNAGAVVLVAESSENIEGMEFDNTMIVSNQRCPAWAVEKAQQLRIPLVSATWVIQCLIEGKICPHNQHDRYKYNYRAN